MTTFLVSVFLISMILATGAVEADSYLLGFGFVVLGLITGILALYCQNYKEKKDKQLYYNEED
jgi:hypothetical protein